MTHITDAIGNTPLVVVPFPYPCLVEAKLEYLNPSGSIKDRSAFYLIKKAEEEGVLKPGGTIVEASSGNQGIAVAMIGKARGYRVIVVVTEGISMEKRLTIESYGAELVICKSAPLEDPEHRHNRAKAITQSIENAFMPDQYFNLRNPEAHYNLLGPEIWQQTDGQVTHFVAAAGTGGTVSGVGRYLKEKNPKIQVIGVDMANSYRSTNGQPKKYISEGIGVDFDTPCVDMNFIDRFVPVNDEEGIAAMQIMSTTYGFLVGTAAGAVCAALIKDILPSLDKNARVVTVFTDSGRAYFSKVHPQYTL